MKHTQNIISFFQGIILTPNHTCWMVSLDAPIDCLSPQTQVTVSVCAPLTSISSKIIYYIIMKDTINSVLYYYYFNFCCWSLLMSYLIHIDINIQHTFVTQICNISCYNIILPFTESEPMRLFRIKHEARLEKET